MTPPARMTRHLPNAVGEGRKGRMGARVVADLNAVGEERVGRMGDLRVDLVHVIASRLQ